MEEEINQSSNQICTPAYIPTQTMLGLIKSNSKNYDNNQMNSSTQSTSFMQQSQLQLDSKLSNQDCQQKKCLPFSTNCATSNFNQQTDISEQKTNPNSFSSNFQLSPCNFQIQKSSQQYQSIYQREPEEMERQINPGFSFSFQNSLQKQNNQSNIAQNGNIEVKQCSSQQSNRNQSNCAQLRVNQNMNEEFISAQQPYATKQKQQIQPCCMNSNNNNCKYAQFLHSNDHQAKLEALKYFETNLSECSSTDLLRLFNHSFIDILVENCNYYKQDQRLAFSSMKVIFMICFKKCQELTCNNKNIFYDKLLSLEFHNFLNKIKQEKVFEKPCCLSKLLEETILKLKKYQFEQQINNCQSNKLFGCQSKPKVCFLSSLFK